LHLFADERDAAGDCAALARFQNARARLLPGRRGNSRYAKGDDEECTSSDF
jgi:hypothetical protein